MHDVHVHGNVFMHGCFLTQRVVWQRECVKGVFFFGRCLAQANFFWHVHVAYHAHHHGVSLCFTENLVELPCLYKGMRGEGACRGGSTLMCWGCPSGVHDRTLL